MDIFPIELWGIIICAILIIVGTLLVLKLAELPPTYFEAKAYRQKMKRKIILKEFYDSLNHPIDETSRQIQENTQTDLSEQ